MIKINWRFILFNSIAAAAAAATAAAAAATAAVPVKIGGLYT